MKSARPKKTNRPRVAAPTAGIDAPFAQTAASRQTKPASRPIPPILLEKDDSAAVITHAAGPGTRFALLLDGTRPAVKSDAPGELPEAYGTRQLRLTARDPHWLYAHWDFTSAQLQACHAKSDGGPLRLRVYRDAAEGEPFRESPVAMDARQAFENVGEGGAKFVAQLGYYQPDARWVAVATSAATLTPADRMADDPIALLRSLPPPVQQRQVLRMVGAAARDNPALQEMLRELNALSRSDAPDAETSLGETLAPSITRSTSAQERTPAGPISIDSAQRVWLGTTEITELVRRELAREMAAAFAASFPGVAGRETFSAGLANPSSSSLPAPARKGFWFNVKAELVLYGATEPNARVTLAGRPISLREDGTFSYRFALPDGDYALRAEALSADGSEGRAAELSFRRATRCEGNVGEVAPDPSLKPARAEHIS